MTDRTAETPIRLLIADDHPVVRDGLSSMFASAPGFEVLGEAADGATAVRLAQELRPDVILMDLRMPRMDGLTAITELTRLGVTARVLVLTTYDTDTHVLPAIEAGATGYLLKDSPPGGSAARCAGRRQWRERAVPFGGGTADEPGQDTRAAAAQPA